MNIQKIDSIKTALNQIQSATAKFLINLAALGFVFVLAILYAIITNKDPIRDKVVQIPVTKANTWSKLAP